MKTLRNCGDLSRAERKVKKRELESTIPALPSNDDSFRIEIQNHALPDLDGRTKAPKKRKRDDEATMGTVRSEKVNIVAKAAERNLFEKPAQQNGYSSGKLEHFTRPAKRMDIDETSGEREKRLIGILNLPEKRHRPKEPYKKSKAQDMAFGGAQVIDSNPATSVLSREKSEAGDERDGKLKENIPIKKVKQKGWAEHEANENVKAKEPRFIVFIGNLPFTATGESIKKHFAAVHPKSVRHLTKKHEPTKSRGCAFVEFEGYDHMKSCLKSFHHSLFDDGISTPRRINVELTAGGGGNKGNRQGKINEKNQKLSEERLRRMQDEDKAKLAKKHPASVHNDVHPSRRARVPDTS